MKTKPILLSAGLLAVIATAVIFPRDAGLRKDPAAKQSVSHHGGAAPFHEVLAEAMYAVEPVAAEASPGNADVSHFAYNRSQRFGAAFLTDGGVRFSGEKWNGTLRLDGAAGQWTADGRRASRSHGAITEWYVNRENGIEHGFTLVARPADADGDSFSLRISSEGIHAVPDPGNPENLHFVDAASGAPLLAYHGLKVWDAKGRILPAGMSATAGGLVIDVHDEGAAYPVTVDPFLVSLEKSVVRPVINPADEEHAGLSVAVDGDWAVVGALDAAVAGVPRAGCAWVLRRTNGNWENFQRIDNPSPGPADRFGVSVAIQGTRIAIGADYDDTRNMVDNGTVNVFAFRNGTWEPEKWFDGKQSAVNMGRSVALDGDTVVAGAPAGDGRIWIFLDEGNGLWSQSERKPALAASSEKFGFSVAVKDGIIAVGSPSWDTNASAANAGRVYLYKRGTDGRWGVAPDKTISAFSVGQGFGFSLAMDDGKLVVGACAPAGWFADANSTHVGDAYVFDIPSLPFNPTPSDGKRLDTQGLPFRSFFGSSVAIRGDVIAVGAFGYSALPGKVRLFEYENTLWEKQEDLSAPGGGNGDAFGVSVGLSDRTIIAGAYGIDSAAGGAFVFGYGLPRIEITGDHIIHQGETRAGIFGEVEIGVSVTREFTMTNTGPIALTGIKPQLFTMGGIESEGSGYSLPKPPVASLSPGESTTFIVRFSPRTAEAENVFLIFNSDQYNVFQSDLDVDELEFALLLFGTGVEAPEIAVAKGAANLPDGTGQVDFGRTPAGKNRRVLLTVRNTGTAELNKLSARITGRAQARFKTGPLPTTLKPGASATLAVNFSPDTAGKRIARLVIASNDKDETPYEISLVGTGVGPEIHVLSKRKPLADGRGILKFGRIPRGDSKVLALTVRNNGNRVLSRIKAAITGKAGKSFRIVGKVPKALRPKKSAVIRVRFLGGKPGNYLAALHIRSNDANERSFDLKLNAKIVKAKKPKAKSAVATTLTRDGLRFNSLTAEKHNGVFPRIEVSGDLVNWRSGANFTEVLSQNEERIRVMDRTPVTPETKRFIRAHFSSPPATLPNQ